MYAAADIEIQTSRAAVLLVDDDEQLCSMLAAYFSDEGFEVVIANDIRRASELLAERAFDLVVLDVVMPGGSGLDLLSDLRGQVYPPVVMMSAHGEELDRLLGYEMGADDYLAKPFRPRELVVRMRVLLRRSMLAGRAVTSAIGNLVVSVSTRRAYVDGKQLQLTDAEFKILVRLFENIGASVGREDLIGFALGRKSIPGDRSVDTHVSNLRGKLRAAGAKGFRVVAERNKGYGLLYG